MAMAVLLAALTPAVAAEGEPGGAPDRNSPGLDQLVSRGPVVLQPSDGAGEEGTPPLTVRLIATWSEVEPAPGRYAWDALESVVESARRAGARIILNIRGGHAVHSAGRASMAPSDTEAVEAWTALLRAASERFGPRVWAWQIGSHPERADMAGSAEGVARDFAFVYKRSAVAVKSAAPEARVALPTIDPSASGFLATLFEEEIAPYADAVSAAFDGGEGARAGLAAIAGLILVHDPSAQLWVNGVGVLVGIEGYGQILRAWSAALESEAALVTFDDPVDSTGAPFHLAAIRNIRGLFSSGYAPLVESGRGVRALTASGGELAGGRVARFFDGDSRTVLMVYDSGAAAQPGDFGVFVLDTVDLAEPALHDLAAGESAPNVALQKDEAAGVTRVALPLAPYPLVLSYRRFTSPEYAAEGESLDVTRERLPSAEEIIARYQAVQEAQDALLQSLSADATEEWHFTAETSGSFDIRFESGFLFDPAVGAEWEQREVFINGVRWRSNSIPEIPFMMPEKSASLPLVVTLSRQYRYTYQGRETVNGFDCHVISFEPLDPGGNLSKGRVWIDTASHARVRIAQSQDRQPTPLVSNDQRDTYAPVIGPDGFRYWILSRIDSEQVYSTLGRNIVMTKSVDLRDFVINGPDFGKRREEALASSHTMLRDTEKGMRYLQRHADGSRTVKENPSTMNLFVLGGILANQSFPFPIPLAGIDWFEADLGGSGAQANVFFAGAFLVATIADPSFLGTRLEAHAELVGLAVSGTDRVVRDNPLTGRLNEKEREEITQKSQSLTLSLGLPFWNYFKLKGSGRLSYSDYGRTDDTCNPFKTPRDTYVRSGTLAGEFNRRAWSLEMEHEWAWRTRHEPWGLDAADPNGGCPPAGGGAIPPDFSQSAKNYVRYGGTITKNFFLPRNQKIFIRLAGNGSRDLDRFSKYRVSFFGDRIRGFSGGGIHYTNGGPWFQEYADCDYANIYNEYKKEMKNE